MSETVYDRLYIKQAGHVVKGDRVVVRRPNYMLLEVTGIGHTERPGGPILIEFQDHPPIICGSDDPVVYEK